MTDVSALGFSIIVKDSKIFPQGFTITQTADGADPFDFPDVTFGAATMDANGNMVYASAPAPVLFNINLLPTTEEDNNMSVLMEAHRPARGRRSTGGDMTITVMYPDGTSTTAVGAKMLGGSPARSITQPSRYKNKVYNFACSDYRFNR